MNSLFPNRRVRRAVRGIEILEPRRLLSATVTTQVPNQSLNASNGTQTLSLNQYFTDNAIPAGDTVINIATNLPAPDNSIPLYLTDAATPKTVQNFIAYINSSEYANTIIHRSATVATQGLSIIQGGGYRSDGTQIGSLGSLQSEASTAILKNATPGTIAMALGDFANTSTTNPNSGTSEWFINISDDSFLDTSSDGPFTAFGQTIYNGLQAATDINNLMTVDDTSNQAFGALPVSPNYSGPSTISSLSSVPSADFVTTTPTIIPGGLIYTVSSSDSSIVSASASGDTLSLTPEGAGGTANVTVTATDLGGGTATSTFAVNVLSNSPTATVGKGASKSITYKDANGATAVVTLGGPGSAAVTFSGNGITQSTAKGVVDFTGSGLSIASIVTSGTTAGSTLTITTKGGANAISIGSITADSLRSIVAKGVTTTGDVQASGTLGSVTLAAANGANFGATSIGSLTVSGGFSDLLALTSTGTSLNSAKIGSINGSAAIGGNGDLWSVGGSVGSITVNGGATDWTPVFAGSVKTITVKGDLASSLVRFTGSGSDIGKLTIGGSIVSSTINGAGNLGTISATSLEVSTLEAGVSGILGANTLPDTAAAFQVDDTIAGVKLKSQFADAFILAQTLGTLALGSLQTSSVPPNGVAAVSIKSITATANKKFTLHNQTSASNLATELTNLGVTLGVVVIDLL